jgi:hypothetical protein
MLIRQLTWKQHCKWHWALLVRRKQVRGRSTKQLVTWWPKRYWELGGCGDENYGSSREHAALSSPFGWVAVIVKSFTYSWDKHEETRSSSIDICQSYDYEKIDLRIKFLLLVLVSFTPGVLLKGVVTKADGSVEIKFSIHSNAGQLNGLSWLCIEQMSQ